VQKIIIFLADIITLTNIIVPKR